MSMLAIITARAGSKGLPGKNLHRIGGKTLTEISVDMAIQLKVIGMVDDIYLSTDSPYLLELTKSSYLLDCPLRPLWLSGDKTKSVDVMLHIIESLEKAGKKYDDVILLQPTSPLRSLSETIHAIQMYRKEKKPSLISACLVEGVSVYGLYIKNFAGIRPLSDNHNKGIPRQLEPEHLLLRNGAFFITSVDYLKKNRAVISQTPAVYEMCREHSINIDSLEEFEEARRYTFKNSNRRLTHLKVFGRPSSERIAEYERKINDKYIMIDVPLVEAFICESMDKTNISELLEEEKLIEKLHSAYFCDGSRVFKDGKDVSGFFQSRITDVVSDRVHCIAEKYVNYLIYDTSAIIFCGDRVLQNIAIR